MAIFNTLRRFFGWSAATGQQSGTQTDRPGVRVYDNARDYGLDGALQVSAVWACVELLADNIATLPLFVYQKSAGPDGHKELARDSMLWLLLHDNPNRRHTTVEFWQFMVMNWLFRGNAYARLVRNDKGEVIEMWPLAADQMIVAVLPDMSLAYQYTYDGKTVIYAEDSIFHWRDKGNGVIGMSRLDYMASSVGVAVSSQNHAAQGFENAGRRPGVFMIDKLMTKEQRAAVRSNFRGLVEGGEDDLLILEAGAKFDPLGLSPADMQLLETRRYSVEDIARWFGISSVLINDTTKTSSWGTGVGQLIEGFYKFRLRTILTSLEKAINKRILTAYQREKFTVEFSIDAILRGSLTERLDTGAKAVQNGLLTRNEWRQTENLPAQDNANTLTAQLNLAPLEMLGQIKGPADASQDTISQ